MTANLPNKAAVDLYRRLADGLSHLVEDTKGISTESLPDDYQWIVEVLAAIARKDPGQQASLEEVRALGARLSLEYKEEAGSAH